MLMRIIGGIMLVLGCSGYGWCLGCNLESRQKELKNLKDYLELFQNEILYRNATMEAGFQNLCRYANEAWSKVFRQIITTLGEGETYRRALEKAKSLIEKNTLLQKEDLIFLEELDLIARMQDKEQQKQRMEYNIRQMENRMDELQQEYGKKRKLYIQLGLLFGALLTIVFF